MNRVTKNPHAGRTGATHDFLKRVNTLASGGAHRHSEVFDDFLELAFCALAKTTHAPDSPEATALEARYMRLVGAREPEYVRAMPELLALAEIGLQEPCDFLGVVSGELGALSSQAGQFFTPYEVSSLCARMTLDAEHISGAIAEKGWVDINEPACGAGGMVLAAADVLAELGFDPATQMRVLAIDVSLTAFRMAYVQLALRGIPATVVHGNTISLESFAEEVTPAMLDFRKHHFALRMLRGVRGLVDGSLAAPIAIEAPREPEHVQQEVKRAPRRTVAQQTLAFEFEESA